MSAYDKIRKDGLYYTFFVPERNPIDNSPVLFFLIFHPIEELFVYIGLQKVSEPFDLSQEIVNTYKVFVEYLLRIENEESPEEIIINPKNPQEDEYSLMLDRFGLNGTLITWDGDIGKTDHYMGHFGEWKLDLTLHRLNTNQLHIYAKLKGKDYINNEEISIILADKQLLKFTQFT